MPLNKIGVYGNYNKLFFEALALNKSNVIFVPGTPDQLQFHLAIGAKFILKCLRNPPFSRSDLLIRYQEEFIKHHGLKTVVTFLDNREKFYHLANRLPEVQFFAVQNGIRFDAFDIMFKDKRYETRCEYVGFGERDRTLIEKTNVKFKKVNIIGSILADYSWSLSKDDDPILYDICLISQWREHIFISPDAKEDFDLIGFRDGYEAMITHLARLKKELGLKVAIAGSRPVESADQEKAYFVKRLGPDIFFSVREHGPASYQTAKKSAVVMGFNSSCIYESFGRGKKALFVNYFKYTPHYYPFENSHLWVLSPNETDYETFRQKYLSLRQLPDEEFKKKAKPQAFQIVEHNPSRPAHVHARELFGLS